MDKRHVAFIPEGGRKTEVEMGRVVRKRECVSDDAPDIIFEIPNTSGHQKYVFYLRR